MKKDIIDYLKNFIEIWDKKGSVKNLKFDAKDEDDFQEFVLYFQNMLGFSNAERKKISHSQILHLMIELVLCILKKQKSMKEY